MGGDGGPGERGEPLAGKGVGWGGVRVERASDGAGQATWTHACMHHACMRLDHAPTHGWAPDTPTLPPPAGPA
jgi:hypothetical protein